MQTNQTQPTAGTAEWGIAIGKRNLAAHKVFCPKRPKFTVSHYVAGGLLYVLWNDTPKTQPRAYRYIPYCEV